MCKNHMLEMDVLIKIGKVFSILKSFVDNNGRPLKLGDIIEIPPDVEIDNDLTEYLEFVGFRFVDERLIEFKVY